MWNSAGTRYEGPQWGRPSSTKESSVLSLPRFLGEQAFWPRAALRPNPILPFCLQPQDGLIDEVHQLEATISALKQKLAQTQ